MFKQPTWVQRAEMRRVLEKFGSMTEISRRGELPFDYCDLCLSYCYGLSDEEKNNLSYAEMQKLVMEAFIKIEIEPDKKKES